MRTETIERHAETEFRGMQDPQLKELHRSLDNNRDAPAGLSGQKLREKVWEMWCAAQGRPVVQQKASDRIVHDKPSSIPNISLTANPPSLTGNGKWGGRCRLIDIQASAEVTQECGKNFSVNGIEVGLRPGQITSVPYPIYHNIARKVAVLETKRTIIDGYATYDQVEREEPAYPYCVVPAPPTDCRSMF